MTAFRHAVGLGSLGVLPFLLVACGGDGGAEAGGAANQGAATEVVIENPGTITGIVNFTGTAPAAEPIDMREEPVCAEKHDGTPMRETVVTGNGTLGNVFVYVKEGLTGPTPGPGEPVELDQDGCIYEPHVLALQTGQTLVVRNSDPVLHNINAQPSVNRGFNFSQPREMTSERSFNSAEVMIPVRCDVHGWMSAYIGVLDHPYAAVTGADGSFSLDNLPPGDYVIEAWHELYGTQTANVTVPPDGNVEATFNYDASMAATAVVPLGAPLDLHDHHDHHHDGLISMHTAH